MELKKLNESAILERLSDGEQFAVMGGAGVNNYSICYGGEETHPKCQIWVNNGCYNGKC